MKKPKWTEALTLTVLVAGLGYFVDLFDITLFGVVRVPSMKALGIEGLEAGVYLYNMQMIGMMIGGVFWGILADKKGRLKVLFGSILLYSIGNIANAFVWNLESYAICRLITGIGLAGELGAAITIVSESLPKHLRGIGTTIVATMGLSGSVTAALVCKHLNWQYAYVIGGLMGLGLLVTRMRLKESLIFQKAKSETVQWGSLKLLFKKGRWHKYLRAILVGAPIYYITGVLFTFSPEITKALGVQGEFSAADALLYGSLGLAIGDLGSGLLSQILQSRKKSVLICLVGACLLSGIYLLRPNSTPSEIYILCFLVGTCAGFWAVLVTMAAEQFGTNLRGTVATTIPNFVRGSAVLVTLGFTRLKTQMPLEQAALLIGGVWFVMAILSLLTLEETFSKDLDYFES